MEIYEEETSGMTYNVKEPGETSIGAYRRDPGPKRTVKLVHGKETRSAHLALTGMFTYDAPGLALEIIIEIGLEMRAVNKTGREIMNTG